MPLHNFIYGNKFVLITTSATIPNNMENGFQNWINTFIDFFSGNYTSENINNFSSYFFKYLTGPAIQPFYLLIPLVFILIFLKIFKK